MEGLARCSGNPNQEPAIKCTALSPAVLPPLVFSFCLVLGAPLSSRNPSNVCLNSSVWKQIRKGRVSDCECDEAWWRTTCIATLFLHIIPLTADFLIRTPQRSPLIPSACLSSSEAPRSSVSRPLTNIAISDVFSHSTRASPCSFRGHGF